MMDKDRLARAALAIGKLLGRREEWDNPAQLLHDVADELSGAGMPPVDTDEYAHRSYWEHMSVDDTLDDLPGQDLLTPTLGITIDASLASPEAITAIFDGLRSIIKGEGGVAEVTPRDPYGRSADD